MRLAELASAVPGARVHALPDAEVTGIAQDSRRVEPSYLFVARPGERFDGAAFAAEAVARGATAVAAERPLELPPSVGQLLVPDARAALGELSSAVLGHPTEHMRLVGVTGTDGKTTTTRLIASVLAAAGRKVGWVTTADVAIGDEIFPSPFRRTTPEAPDLQGVLQRLVQGGVEDAVVEVSSHALALDRVAGCRFDAAVFTNLAPEHLDFHGTMEAYAAAKARLFEMLALPTTKRWSRMGVVNADDPASLTMVAASSVGIVSYALGTPADVTATHLEFRADSTRFTLVTPIGEAELSTPLLGRHNVYNWLAAASVALGWGIDLENVVEAAERTAAPPGRLERVEAGQPFEVFVDFAHTPQALGVTLGTLRSLSRGQLYLVFGMAGNRDSRNRPIMGQIAAQGADFFVISTDDPENEDPAEIARQVAAGAASAGASEGIDYSVRLDRRSAIREVLSRARPGDTVLLAGKGHETRMTLADRAEPWSDPQAAAQILAELGYRS